jgi:hypothetical protein
LGFLGLGLFGRGNPRLWGWKGLDFLGFSRPNRAFSMGYAGFSLKEISRAPFAAEPERERLLTIFACGEGRIGHRASVIQFLLFCKKLLSEPFLSGRLHPKETRWSRNASCSSKQVTESYCRHRA